MDDQSSDVHGLVYALNELLNIQDIQELELASPNVEALVDTLNSLDIQESKYASSDVEKLESSFEKKGELLASWSELPPELLYQVSEHFLDLDLSNFRATCKSWRSSAPIFRCRTLLDTPDFESPYNLMSLGVLGNKCRFFHPLKCNGTNQKDIPVVLGARLHYSKKGWLLLSANDRRGDCHFFFFHPFNMIKIELPTNRCAFHTMSFSSPPTSKDCFVIGLPFWGNEFGIVRRGEESWNTFRFKRSLPGDLLLSNCNPILYKGRCYCLCESGELGVFDLNEYLRNPECQNSFDWTHNIVPSEFPAELLDSVLQGYLLESNGQLFSVFELRDYAPCFHVFSLNPNKSRMKWHAVKNLRDQMFYVSAAGSFSETAVARGAGNKIYLPNVEDNRCVFYSLKKKMCGSFFSEYSTRTATHGKEHNNCTWIKRTPATLDENFKW